MLRTAVMRHRSPVLALVAGALTVSLLATPSAADSVTRQASSAPPAAAGAPAPDAFARASARKRTKPIALRNPSFRQGIRHWTAAGRYDTIRPARNGRGSGPSIALSTSRGGAAELRPKNRLAVPGDSGRVRALAWVRTAGPAARVSIRIEAPSARKPLASRSFRVTRNDGWRRISVRQGVTTAPGSRLGLSIVASGLGGSTLLVDDVALTTVAPSATGNGLGWASGVSGDGAADGTFARWRGASATIAGTWNDSFEAQQNQWTVLDGAEYSTWEGDLDVAVGGIYPDRGDSWRAAAGGAYDARWAQVLTTLASAWADRPGTLYIRFAHEFNGEWYPWKVTGAQVEDFKQAWRRFRALQVAIMPDAKLVLSPSAETSASLGLDWRDAFPGGEYVDVLSVDYYNQYPFVDTAKEFSASMNSVDAKGAPRGLEAHRRFAQDNGLPFAISEWSSNASMGDSRAFMRGFRGWLAANGGSGPGKVLYEVLFNVAGYGEGQFQIAPQTQQPEAAKAYRKLW